MKSTLHDSPRISPSSGSAKFAGGPQPSEPASLARVEPRSGMRPITLLQPGRILFGNGCSTGFIEHLARLNLPGILLFSSSAVLDHCGELLAAMKDAGFKIEIGPKIDTEPTISQLEQCLQFSRKHPEFGVVGVGGGSAMDVAKLVAALAENEQTVQQVFGINLLRGRNRFLACLPTTSGTGSEVSPNAILLDESSNLKKGVISPHLVPDVACVDPLFTLSVPAAVTAATGLDALTHCIEAYANKNAHPLIDHYALEGVRLIASYLLESVHDGQNRDARANLALGSLYGGLCLGPVNTAAVHALSYPLGSEFHVAHGISNAVLLPHVLRFNLPSAEQRYADIAQALGVKSTGNVREMAERGIDRIGELLRQCPIPVCIADFGVPEDALPRMAKAALTITRLLKNNPRDLTEEDAVEIYRSAYRT